MKGHFLVVKQRTKNKFYPMMGIMCALHLNSYNGISNESGRVQGVRLVFSLFIFLLEGMHQSHLALLKWLKGEMSYLSVN